MSHNLTPSPANFSTVTVAVPDDAIDFRTAASLYPAFQRLCDNDAWLGAQAFTSAGGARTLTGSVTVNPGTGPFTWTFACDVTFGGALGAGTAILGATSASSLSVAGNTSLSTASISGPVTSVGAGRVRRRVITGADADSNYGINDADVIIGATMTTADRTYTINTTGANEGDVLKIVLGAGSNKILHVAGIRDLQITTGYATWVELTYHSGAWVQTGYNIL